MKLVDFTFALVLIHLLPSIVLSQTSFSNNQNPSISALMLQACENLDDPSSCLTNLHSRIQFTTSHENPNSILEAALENTLNEARLAIESITKFTTFSVSAREQIAIEDCKELVDFSIGELAWSVAEMRKIRAGFKNTHSEGNLKAWLSAALSNQDTCLEGFEATDLRLERFIRGSLTQVTQLISNVLRLYVQFHSLPFKPERNSSTIHNHIINEEFPNWMDDEEKGLLNRRPNRMQFDAIVALDGSGNYRSIAQAIYEAPNYSNKRYVIHVKRGLYHENIDMKKKKSNIMLVGDGIGATIITGNRNFMQGWTTFRTATLAVSGKGFIARDMTIRNTAGAESRQAVALRVDSDQSAIYRCSIEGYQDTLYAHSLRQFYRECNIYGTIDFIFGNGAAVLQNCKIFTRKPLPLQKVTITAQGRKSPDQSTGFSIQDSYVYATQPTYLGRPWKEYSRTVYMNTYMSAQVQPRGWLEWYGDFALGTLWYGEYMNYGAGASLSGRVNWPGYHIIKDSSLATFYTVAHFIDGLSWLPATGVKFYAGLTN